MNTIDDIIQQKANRHEASVPPDAWNNIVKKKKKRRYVFFWWFSILLLAGLVTGSYFKYFNESGNAIAEKNISSESSETTSTTNSSDIQNYTTKDPQEISSVNNDQASGNIEESKKIEPVTEKRKNTVTQNERTESKPIKKGTRQLAGKTKDLIPLINPNKLTKNYVSAAKNRRIKREKQKSNIAITAPATEELLTTVYDKTTASEVAINASSGKNEQEIIIDNNKSMTEKSIVIKNTLSADTLLKKSTPAKTTDNKTAANLPGKKTGKKPWFIDLSILPVLPIQQYDKSAAFSRTLSSSNSISEFSGKLVNTSIDPSLAFSISIRKKISTKIIAGTGLQYLQLKEIISIAGTETTTKFSIVDRLINGINGPELVIDTIKTITEGTRQINAINSYQFLSIPVFVQYIIVERPSWSLAVVAGANFNIYSRYRNAINSDSTAALLTSSQSPTDINNLGLAVYGGLRFGKIVGKRLEFFAMSSINWSISQPYIKKSLLIKKIHFAGIGFGISYKLN